MRLAKSGQIGNVCEPNALMTLMEYLMDYADEDLRVKGKAFILEAANDLKNPTIKDLLLDNIKKIEKGARDLYL
jgi:2-iminoacetate synthase